MEQLSSYDSYVAELKAETARLEERLKEACGQLSDVRKKYASRLVRTVEAALRDLNFLDVSFDMQFDQLDHYTSNGTDDGEFMISTNPGEPLKLSLIHIFSSVTCPGRRAIRPLFLRR